MTISDPFVLRRLRQELRPLNPWMEFFKKSKPRLEVPIDMPVICSPEELLTDYESI
jgi:hypothetical protein